LPGRHKESVNHFFDRVDSIFVLGNAHRPTDDDSLFIFHISAAATAVVLEYQLRPPVLLGNIDQMGI
jgi:hypothetical protein